MATNNQLPNCPPLRFPEFNDEWERTTLGEICQIVGGGTPSTEIDKYWGGNISWFTPSEIQKKYIGNSVRTITEEGLNNSGAKLLPKGTILLTTRATIGECSISTIPCCTNQGFQSLVVNLDKSSTEFIYQKVQTLRNELLIRANGSTFKEITAQEIRGIRIFIPSLEEQTKIASFLSLLDERIEAQRQTIEERKKQKKALLQQIFSQSLRFPKFDDEWEYIPNKQLFAIANNRNTDFQRDLVLSASQSLGMTCREKIGIDIKYKEESISTYKLVNKGDYIIHLRSFQGGFAFSDIDGVCSPAYTIIRPIGGLYYGFLREYFRSTSFINSLVLVTYGIRDGRSISVEEWMLGNTILPSLAEQERIAKLFTIFDERIEVEEALLACYEMQKRYLLRQMFV